MKKIFSLLTLLLAMATTNVQAQGWPSDYSGVMLQAFIYDDYETSQWQTLTAKVDTLSKYFDLIWIPQSGYCGGSNNMGYSPVYWLFQNSSFGTATELRKMIAAYKEKGTGFIADIVVNHKNGATGWIDFPNETKTLTDLSGTKRTWSVNWGTTDAERLQYICSGDECKDNGYTPTGAADTGENFDGCRDLDHTNSTVQANIKTYLDYLVNYIGYTGFRYDMAKGYDGKYVGIYNASVGVKYSVGEYWSGNSEIKNWIDATKYNNTIQSGAFDFQFKYAMNKAFGSGDYSQLSYRGLLDYDKNYRRYSITFCDNHDTGRDDNKLAWNWSAANAYMLASPGTPCVWIKHYMVDTLSINHMILARKAAGLTNTGTQIIKGEMSNGGYIYQTRGTNGDLYVQCGNAVNNGTPSGFKLVAQGDAYKFFCSTNLDVPECDETPVTPSGSSITIYCKASTAPYLYAWNSSSTTINGTWPGTKMTQTTTVNGTTYYYKKFDVSSINIIFNNGSGAQTADITGLTADSFFSYDGNTSYTKLDVVTDNLDVNREQPVKAEYYNLAGQRIASPVKGINIVNGKKVLK